MAKYDHINFKPPKGVQKAARIGLEMREEHGRGGTAVGVARARDLSNGKTISPETAKRMKSYFARHEVDQKAEGFNVGEKGYPSAGRVAWMLWGSFEGQRWSNKLVDQMNAADEKGKRSMAKKKNTYADRSKMVMRFVEVRADTFTDEGVDVVVATDNPVQRMDWARGQVISEILDMGGVEFRSERNQLPIVDSHNPSTVRNVLGSVRDLRVVKGELVGRAMFAQDTASQEAYQKVRDGHLTDFSITASVNEVKTLAPNEKVKVRGRTIKYPAEIVTRWTPTDASLVATGADSASTVRSLVLRSYDSNEWKGDEMPVTREQLIELGMPEEIAESSDVAQWLAQNIGASQALETEETSEAEASVQSTEGSSVEEPSAQAEEQEAPEYVDAVDADAEPVVAGAEGSDTLDRAISDERDRVKLIRTLARSANIDSEVADQWCDSGVPLEEVRKKVQEEMEKQNQPAGTSVHVTRSAIDKAEEAVRNGLLKRAYQSAGIRKQPELTGEGMGNVELIRMAEVMLRAGGINTDRMAKRDIAAVAMGNTSTMNRLGIKRDGEAYHTTGSFANLLLDASNKTLLAAYDEAPYTWNLWARQASSVADFKNINRIRYSEAASLDVVPENAQYSENSMSDEKESYSVEKYGKVTTVSWETIVNDDLDALARTPAMMGTAARRTQNERIYEVLTQNANMADGNALFSSAHSNFVSSGSGAAPSVATLNSAYTSMMTQTGVDGTTIINVEPAFIIAPPSLRGTVLQLLGSFSDPVAGGSSAGNANTLNIHQNVLTPIIEPQLESASQTSWYLAARNNLIDTVEIAFLQGEESPVLESDYDMKRDCYFYKVRQTFGVKAIDWRGLYKNFGA
jgi:hypothetical protein